MSVCSEEVIGVTQEHTHITQEHSHTGSFLGGGGTATLKKWGLAALLGCTQCGYWGPSLGVYVCGCIHVHVRPKVDIRCLFSVTFHFDF